MNCWNFHHFDYLEPCTYNQILLLFICHLFFQYELVFFFIIICNYVFWCMNTWSYLFGAFILFNNEINSCHEHITIAYQDGPEDNKIHFNLMLFIGYISFMIYCTVLRTCTSSILSLYQMLPVYQCCSFLVAHSVFSSIYLLIVSRFIVLSC
jgi:hypothetical protein